MPKPKNANLVTYLGTGIKGVTGFISTSYWLATWFDLISSKEQDFGGVSFYALGFGVTIGLWSAACAAYAHYTVGKQHQPNQDLNNEEKGEHAKPKNLTPLQKMALVGHYVGDVGEIAGPLSFVPNLAVPIMPRWAELVVQGGATFFGAAGSLLDWNVSQTNMQKANQASQSIDDEERGETKGLINS
jgi:hypothetical protein